MTGESLLGLAELVILEVPVTLATSDYKVWVISGYAVMWLGLCEHCLYLHVSTCLCLNTPIS